MMEGAVGEGLSERIFFIPAIICGACTQVLREKFLQTQGIVEAHFDLEKKQAQIFIEPDKKISDQDIINMINQLGYDDPAPHKVVRASGKRKRVELGAFEEDEEEEHDKEQQLQVGKSYCVRIPTAKTDRCLDLIEAQFNKLGTVSEASFSGVDSEITITVEEKPVSLSFLKKTVRNLGHRVQSVQDQESIDPLWTAGNKKKKGWW